MDSCYLLLISTPFAAPHSETFGNLEKVKTLLDSYAEGKPFSLDELLKPQQVCLVSIACLLLLSARDHRFSPPIRESFCCARVRNFVSVISSLSVNK